MSIEVLNRLRDEHRNINGLLRILERQLASITRGDRPDYRLMYDITHYLSYYPDRYHHPYEDLLLSRLAELRPELSTAVTGIKKEHYQIASEGSRLRNLIGEIIDGLFVSRDELLQSGAAYVDCYRRHMQTEDDRLFTVMPVTLKPVDWVVLVSAFHWQPVPVFSEEASREYQHLRDSISTQGAGAWPWKSVSGNTCPACSGI